MNAKKILFTILFIALGFGAMQVPFTQLLGANVKFSLFDFYGPIAGAFLGSIAGMLTVLGMQITNWAVQGFHTDMGTIIRIFPMLFAVLYFSKKSKFTLLVPVVAMIAFWAHPEGRQAWYYALYWLIPLVAYTFYDEFLLARALGTTFTAHAVGGALWIWAFNMKASIWISLIPIVWKERMMMAIGICATYIAFNYILSFASQKWNFTLPFVKLNPKYSTK